MSKLTDDWDSFFEDDTTSESWDAVSNDFADVETAQPQAAQEPQAQEPQAHEPQPQAEEPAKAADEDILSVDEDFEDEYDEFDLEEEKAARASRKAAPGKGSQKGNILTIAIAALAVIAIVLIVVLLVKGTGSESADTTAASTEAQAETAAWEKDSEKDVLDLVNRYYAAKVLVDTYTLGEIIDPSVTLDTDVLAEEAKVVEGYQDIACYTTKGINEGEFALYITYSMKFKNITTPAPGLVPAYVRTDDTGALRLIPSENIEDDAEIYAYIAKVSSCDTITNLSTDTQEAYLQARQSDSALNAYITSITGETIAETTAAADETTSAVASDTTAAPTEAESSGVFSTTAAETTAAETTAAETTASETTTAVSTDDFEADDNEMYITKDQVNVRKAPSTDSEVIKSLSKGQKVYTTGKSSEWYRVCLADGTTAYISSQFLSSDPVETSATTTAAAADEDN